MKTKIGVKLSDLKIEMRPVLVAADKIWKKHGKELVITCTGGGVHSPGSLHPYGYAVDKRIRYFTTEVKLNVARELREALGKDYDVIVHKTHIHVEYQKVLNV